MNELIPHLQQFQLHIHSLDFIPGTKILENIENAIENSNCAILIVSQGFVESPWCRKEFDFCYSESVTDPAFKLLVIMPDATGLQNLNFSSCKSLEYFVKENTYLEKTDPALWRKIADQLKRVKGGNRENDGEGEEICEQETMLA